MSHELTDHEYRQLERRADKSKRIAAVLGFFLPPVAYVYVGSTKWAIINLVTANYLFFGLLLTPYHSIQLIEDARLETIDDYSPLSDG